MHLPAGTLLVDCPSLPLERGIRALWCMSSSAAWVTPFVYTVSPALWTTFRTSVNQCQNAPITFLSAALPDFYVFNPFCEKVIALWALQPPQKRSATVFKSLLATFINTRTTAVSMSSYVTTVFQQENISFGRDHRCFLWTKGAKDLTQFYCLLGYIHNTNSVAI